MSKQKLEHELIALLPQARRYGRALIGESDAADTLLSSSAINVLNSAPLLSFLTPTNMVLPWLIVEFHKLIDSSSEPVDMQKHIQANQNEAILIEQFDSSLEMLTKIQKRVYLLMALERFPITVVGGMLSLSSAQVTEYFKQAHQLVSDHLNRNCINE